MDILPIHLQEKIMEMKKDAETKDIEGFTSCFEIDVLCSNAVGCIPADYFMDGERIKYHSRVRVLYKPTNRWILVDYYHNERGWDTPTIEVEDIVISLKVDCSSFEDYSHSFEEGGQIPNLTYDNYKVLYDTWGDDMSFKQFCILKREYYMTRQMMGYDDLEKLIACEYED